MTVCEIIITIISILLSALVSMGISKYYYKKACRNSALSRIVIQIYSLTMYHPDKEGIEKFKQIILNQELNYLKKNEYNLVLNLYSLYKEVGCYSEIELFALVLRDHYKKTVEENVKNVEIERVYDEINKIDTFIEPIKYSDCAKDIKRILLDNNIYYNLLDDDNYIFFQNKLNAEFNQLYQSTFQTTENIDFFNDCTVLDIMKKSDLKKISDCEEERYFKTVAEFKKVFKEEIHEEWSEFFLENEGYPF